MLTVCCGSAGKAIQTKARDFWAQASVFPRTVGTAGDAHCHLPPVAGSEGRLGGRLWSRCTWAWEKWARLQGKRSLYDPGPPYPLSGMFVLNSFPSKSWVTSVQFSYSVISDFLHVLRHVRLVPLPMKLGSSATFFIFIFIPKILDLKNTWTSSTKPYFFVPQFCRFIRAEDFSQSGDLLGLVGAQRPK